MIRCDQGRNTLDSCRNEAKYVYDLFRYLDRGEIRYYCEKHTQFPDRPLGLEDYVREIRDERD